VWQYLLLFSSKIKFELWTSRHTISRPGNNLEKTVIEFISHELLSCIPNYSSANYGFQFSLSLIPRSGLDGIPVNNFNWLSSLGNRVKFWQHWHSSHNTFHVDLNFCYWMPDVVSFCTSWSILRRRQLPNTLSVEMIVFNCCTSWIRHRRARILLPVAKEISHSGNRVLLESVFQPLRTFGLHNMIRITSHLTEYSRMAEPIPFSNQDLSPRLEDFSSVDIRVRPEWLLTAIKATQLPPLLSVSCTQRRVVWYLEHVPMQHYKQTDEFCAKDFDLVPCAVNEDHDHCWTLVAWHGQRSQVTRGAYYSWSWRASLLAFYRCIFSLRGAVTIAIGKFCSRKGPVFPKVMLRR